MNIYDITSVRNNSQRKDLQRYVAGHYHIWSIGVQYVEAVFFFPLAAFRYNIL